MSPNSIPTFSSRRPGALSQWALALAAALAVMGCGGGGGGDTTALESPAAYTAGPISGFGSIIVNGVRFDDSAATVGDDDNVSRSRSELKLGMMVAVDSGAVANASGRALHVRFHTVALGPVEAVNAGAGTLTVLGQAVQTTTTTVFGDGLSGGLASLAPGQVVSVHGLWDAAASAYVATRIETKSNAPLYRLRGNLANLDTTAKTFTLGSAVIDYSAATLPATALANGQRVRVTLQPTAVNGRWVATMVRAHDDNRPGDGSHFHVRGSITAFTSATAFTVNDLPVDATNAVFDDGTAGVVLGARVEVEGQVVNGVLVASKVELESRHGDDDRHKFELHGAITSIDTTAKTFVLRGITVSYGGSVSFDKGTEAGLVVGAKVEVKGVRGADATTLTATRIKFED